MDERVIITNKFWYEFEVSRKEAMAYVKAWDILPENVVPVKNTIKNTVAKPVKNIEVIDDEDTSEKTADTETFGIDVSTLDLVWLQKEFAENFGKPVPPNKRNDMEWIKAKLVSNV